MNKAVLVIFVLVIILVALSIMSAALGYGFASGGGSASAELLSPDTTNYAIADGDNGVAIAIQGDENSVNMAYSNQQDKTDDEQEAKETRTIGGIGLLMLAGCACLLVLIVVLKGGI